jgi:hypothetical protein
MIGQSSVFPNGFPWNKKSAGQKSRVATGILAMELDHDSGKMTGTVISGPFKGTNLEEMSAANLQSLYDYWQKLPIKAYRAEAGSSVTNPNGVKPDGAEANRPARCHVTR